MYPYGQDARHARGWQHVARSGAADQLPEEYKELAWRRCGRKCADVGRSSRRSTSRRNGGAGPVVSNGMEVKEIASTAARPPP